MPRLNSITEFITRSRNEQLKVAITQFSGEAEKELHHTGRNGMKIHLKEVDEKWN